MGQNWFQARNCFFLNGIEGLHIWKLTCVFLIFEVLGESMAGISQNAKTGDLLVFGECVGVASKALCGLTEAAAQVRD